MPCTCTTTELELVAMCSAIRERRVSGSAEDFSQESSIACGNTTSNLIRYTLDAHGSSCIETVARGFLQVAHPSLLFASLRFSALSRLGTRGAFGFGLALEAPSPRSASVSRRSGVHSVQIVHTREYRHIVSRGISLINPCSVS